MLSKIFLVIFLIPFAISNAQDEDLKKLEHSYIGVQPCAMCHKSEKQGSQLAIWEKSKHAQTYETLKSEEANKIAKEKGFDKPAVEVEDCLKCHASGYDAAPEFLGKKFNVSDGVQCETCHGPGSDYKSLKVMKDQELAKQNGLWVHENIRDFCVTCHNPESPTFVEFDYDKAFDQIKHPVPQN